MNIPSIPTSPMGTYTAKDGTEYPVYMTTQWSSFINQLIIELQGNASEEGLVAPSQTSANITTIQNHTVQDVTTTYTCAGGTLIYNSDNDTLQVAILSAGVPHFKTVTVT